MQAEVEKVKKEALEEQRADFEDKLAEYEKLLVKIYLIVWKFFYLKTLVVWKKCNIYNNDLYKNKCTTVYSSHPV